MLLLVWPLTLVSQDRERQARPGDLAVRERQVVGSLRQLVVAWPLRAELPDLACVRKGLRVDTDASEPGLLKEPGSEYDAGVSTITSVRAWWEIQVVGRLTPRQHKNIR